MISLYSTFCQEYQGSDGLVYILRFEVEKYSNLVGLLKHLTYPDLNYWDSHFTWNEFSNKKESLEWPPTSVFEIFSDSDWVECVAVEGRDINVITLDGWAMQESPCQKV